MTSNNNSLQTCGLWKRLPKHRMKGPPPWRMLKHINEQFADDRIHAITVVMRDEDLSGSLHSSEQEMCVAPDAAVFASLYQTTC